MGAEVKRGLLHSRGFIATMSALLGVIVGAASLFYVVDTWGLPRFLMERSSQYDGTPECSLAPMQGGITVRFPLDDVLMRTTATIYVNTGNDEVYTASASIQEGHDGKFCLSLPLDYDLESAIRVKLVYQRRAGGEASFTRFVPLRPTISEATGDAVVYRADLDLVNGRLIPRSDR